MSPEQARGAIALARRELENMRSAVASAVRVTRRKRDAARVADLGARREALAMRERGDESIRMVEHLLERLELSANSPAPEERSRDDYEAATHLANSLHAARIEMLRRAAPTAHEMPQERAR